MHWTARIEPVPASQSEVAVNTLQVPGETSSERDEQIAPAKAAIVAIFRSGCLSNEGRFTAYLSGLARRGKTW